MMLRSRSSTRYAVPQLSVVLRLSLKSFPSARSMPNAGVVGSTRPATRMAARPSPLPAPTSSVQSRRSSPPSFSSLRCRVGVGPSSLSVTPGLDRRAGPSFAVVSLSARGACAQAGVARHRSGVRSAGATAGAGESSPARSRQPASTVSIGHPRRLPPPNSRGHERRHGIATSFPVSRRPIGSAPGDARAILAAMTCERSYTVRSV